MTSNKSRARARAEEFVQKLGAPPVSTLTGAGEGAQPPRSVIPPVIRPPKQTKGAMGAIEQTLALIPVKQVVLISLKELHVRPGYERDPREFDDPEFHELVESIRATGGNTQPIDVREVRGSGHPTLYQIIAGERRFMALSLLNEESKKAHEADPTQPKERFNAALCNVRVLDDDRADQIHDLENAKRAAKRPFSLAKQFVTMMSSGRYSTQTELADRLGRDKGQVSRLLSLYEKAPADLWSKVEDAIALKGPEVPILLKAFDKPAFIDWVRAQRRAVSLATVLRKAREACARPKPQKTLVDKVREVERGDAFHIVIPKGLPDEVRAKVLAIAKELASKAVVD